MIRIPTPELRLSAIASRHLAGDLETARTKRGSRTLFDRYLDFLTSEHFDPQQRAVALTLAEPRDSGEESDVRLHALVAAIIITVAVALGFCVRSDSTESSPRVMRLSETMERPIVPSGASTVSAPRIDVVT